MMHPDQIPDVADNELLARFIVNSNEKRPDGKVSHKLFMPYKWVHPGLSWYNAETAAAGMQLF